MLLARRDWDIRAFVDMTRTLLSNEPSMRYWGKWTNQRTSMSNTGLDKNGDILRHMRTLTRISRNEEHTSLFGIQIRALSTICKSVLTSAALLVSLSSPQVEAIYWGNNPWNWWLCLPCLVVCCIFVGTCCTPYRVPQIFGFFHLCPTVCSTGNLGSECYYIQHFATQPTKWCAIQRDKWVRNRAKCNTAL